MGAEGKQMEDVAARAGPVTERAIKYWGKRFRECLQALAVALGATGKRSHSPNDRYTELSIKHSQRH